MIAAKDGAFGSVASAAASAARVCGERRVAAHQGSSHRREPRPNSRKLGRQPTLAISSPPKKIPKAGPRLVPSRTMALARPISWTGRCLAISLELHGKAALSPSPSRTLSSRSAVKPVTSPVAAVASDHNPRPTARIR